MAALETMIRVPITLRRALKQRAATEDCPMYVVIERLLREEDTRQAQRASVARDITDEESAHASQS